MSTYVNARKAHRDDPLRNALVNLLEDLDCAQTMLVEGKRDAAMPYAREAVRSFASLKAVNLGSVRDLTMSVNDLGRFELFLDYADDLGEIRITYTARARCN